MTETVCGATGQNAGTDVFCDMREGHGGPHVDTWASWEWPK